MSAVLLIGSSSDLLVDTSTGAGAAIAAREKSEKSLSRGRLGMALRESLKQETITQEDVGGSQSRLHLELTFLAELASQITCISRYPDTQCHNQFESGRGRVPSTAYSGAC
jgi:hypothetical protein